jgi:hypothetical protein
MRTYDKVGHQAFGEHAFGAAAALRAFPSNSIIAPALGSPDQSAEMTLVSIAVLTSSFGP